MTAILRLQLDDKDPVRVNSAINQLAESYDRNARGRLTANTTFYVSTSGSDANSGASAAFPFLTIQHAYDYIVSSLDTAGFTVTIQLADGTYTSGLLVATSWSGGGQITLQGNATTPDNVIISTSGHCIYCTSPLPAIIKILNMKLVSSAGSILVLSAPGIMNFSNINFGACPNDHIFSGVSGASIIATGDYKISGGAFIHAAANNGGNILTTSITVTFVGTPTFSYNYAYAVVCGVYSCFSITFSGSFIGGRYFASTNGVINTGGGGVNYFPGTVAGSTDGFGVYL